jgi:dTDP-glucose pyrophosphorylase
MVLPGTPVADKGLIRQFLETGRHTMKALILAYDRAEETREAHLSHSCCMNMCGDRHLIQYSLDAAVESEAEEILVAAGHGAEEIINAFGITYRDRRVRYVLLPELFYFLDALHVARESLEHDDFILFSGDEIVRDPQPRAMVENFYEQDLFVECGVVQVPASQTQVSGYGVMYDPYDYRIYRIVDRPRRPVNGYMGTSICVFRNEIVEYLEPVYAREYGDETGLSHLVQHVIDDGYCVKLFVVGSSCDKQDGVYPCEDERVVESPWNLELEPVF